MKECYFCKSIIPEDATICPMCDSDLTEVENKAVENPPIPEEYTLNQEKKSRKLERSISFKKITNSFINYIIYSVKRISHPVQIDQRSERHPIYGYITLLLSSLLSAGILTRVFAALEDTYKFMLDISILPTLTFTFRPFEWFWKLTIFFICYFILFTLVSYLFKKASSKEPLNFNNWVTQYTAMNTFYFVLLMLVFILAMVLPLGLAVPAMLVTFLYCLSYIISFVATLYNIDRATSENKTFYQALIGVSVHFLIMSFVAYLLFKI